MPPRSQTLHSTAVLLALLTAGFALRGYTSLRVDHVTQVPMLLKLLDPDLYPRDWFFNAQGQYPVRIVYLWLQTQLHKILPQIEWILLAQYLLYLAAFIGGLWFLNRRLGQRLPTLLLWLFLLCTLNEFADVGTTNMIENAAVPRMFPNAAVLWAVALLIRGGPWTALLSGILMGLTGLIQAAPPLQMTPLLAIWLLWSRGARRGGLQCLLLIAGLLATIWPQSLLMGNVVAGDDIFTQTRMLNFVATLRHPHLMLPLHFAPSEYWEAGALLLLFWTILRRYPIGAARTRLLNLITLLLLLALAAPIFIHAIPVLEWILFQPYRTFAFFRLFVLAFIARHLLDLLRSGRRIEVARGLMLLLACFASWRHPWVLISWLLIEAALLALRPWIHRASLHLLHHLLPWFGVAAWLTLGKRHLAAFILVWLTLAYGPGVVHALRRGTRALAAWRPLPYAVAALGAAFILLLLNWPFRAWERPVAAWSPLDHAHLRLARRYQVIPFPIHAIEKAGVWARHHTEKDALFVIPPSRALASFHYWSGRSVVFNVKLYPFLQTELAEWAERYYAHGGILEPGRRPHDVALMHADVGTFGLYETYRWLDPVTLRRLARRYGADYLIHYNPRVARSDYFEIVAGPFQELHEELAGTHYYHLWVLRPSQTPLPES